MSSGWNWLRFCSVVGFGISSVEPEVLLPISSGVFHSSYINSKQGGLADRPIIWHFSCARLMITY